MAANLLFILILIALASPILLQAANAAYASNAVCRRTTHKDVCLLIVESDGRANLKTSRNGIATILRDGAVSTTVSTNVKISNLLRTATDRHEIASLRTCSAGYSKAIPSLRSANLRVINCGTYPALIALISDINDEPHDCKLLFQEPPAIRSPISAENQRLRDIYAVTLKVVNLVVCNNLSFC